MFLNYAVVSFAVAAVFGITMAVRHFSGKFPGNLLAGLHGGSAMVLLSALL